MEKNGNRLLDKKKIMKKTNKIKENGFTLVELLAVIVILAIILVIAVPKVMSIIEDGKKGTLESTAKMIASAAEKQKVQNKVLGNTEEITCESVAKLNDVDYASCSIEFDDNTAKVTIEGSGKFEGLHVCDGTKTESIAQINECDFGGGSSLPEIGGEPDDFTWEEITTISEAGKADEYFDLGDTKTITLTTGEEVVMEIVAFNADEKTAGGYAAITWLSKNLLKTEHAMNSTKANAGGWEASEMRAWLQTDVYNTLPAEVKSAIVAVNKTYSVAAVSTTSTTKTCSDTVWIPSFRETSGTTASIFGGEKSGVTYESFLKSNRSLKKLCNGAESSWWYRSAEEKTNNQFSYMAHDGSNRRVGVSDTARGVALGFCTG